MEGKQGKNFRGILTSTSAGIEEECATFGMRGPRRVRVVVISAMDEDRARRVVEMRMRAGPDVLVSREALGLVDRLRVEAGGLIPKSCLVDVCRVVVAPEEYPGRIWQQHSVHERLPRQPGKLFPAPSYSVCAAIELHRRTGVISRVQRKSDLGSELLCLLKCQVDSLAGTQQSNEPLHHVHFDMTVNKEVAAKVVCLGTLVRAVAVLKVGRQQQHRRCLSLDEKRLCRSDAPHVDRLIGEPPALPMGMKVVPIHPEVEVEHVPSDSLTGMRDDGGGVADERSSIEAEGRQVVAAGFDDAVLAGSIICPGDLPADPEGDIGWAEREVDNRYAISARAAGLHGQRAGHDSAVDAADVIVS